MRRLLPLAIVSAVVAGCSSATTSDTTSAPGSTEAGITLDAAMRQQCFTAQPVNGSPLRIATTVAPITSIVSAIVGNSGATIVGIVPEGTNSHTFDPPPSAASTLEEANIIFVNGLVLEEPTRDLAEANLAETSAICELGTATLPAEEWIYDFSFPESGGKPNPHVWTNPPMARKYGELVRDVLVSMDPVHSDQYRDNFDKWAAHVDELDEAIKTATATLGVDQRKLLTYHDAYAYFARHYGWSVIGAIQPSSFEEPTPKEIARLIEQVKAEKVKAIFGSEVFPSPVLEQIGKEAGVTYVDELRDDDLPGSPGESKHSWFGLMQFDYVTLISSLGGDATAIQSVALPVNTDSNAEYPQ